MAWATPEDVVDRWVGSQPIVATEDTLELLIDDAEDYILGEYPDLHERVQEGDVTERQLLTVVVRMIHRLLRNPDGVRQRQQTTGPYSSGYTIAGDAPGELFHLTDADRRILSGQHAGSRAFSINPAAHLEVS